ncbi:MAG: TIGR03545 family protein, partial [Betaproteobacteria bacterium]|nr:TIGR03545 family protein [Betaproteobacteria bacterium]
MLALIALYFTLFFDSHLRRALEHGATRANGAEVNIGRLKTSFLKASVALEGIAFTDPELPARNRLQIGAVNFGMSWDALLRGKVVIGEASVLDAEFDIARAQPGRVLPPEPAQKEEEGNGAGKRMLEAASQEFSGNALGDLASLASGSGISGKLGEISGDLKSSARLEALQKSLDDSDQPWQARLASMPKTEEFAALRKRLAAVNLGDAKDVALVQASLRELQSIRDEFDAKTKSVRDTGTV